MESIFDSFASAEADKAQDIMLKSFPVRRDPSRFVPITVMTTTVYLHYQESEPVRGYHHCLKPGKCPPCLVGATAVKTSLLPVLSIEENEVQILRIAGNFRTALSEVFTSKSDLNSLITAQSLERGKYILTKDQLPSHFKITLKVQNFVKDFEDGKIDIKAVFRTPTVFELESIPKIRNQMTVLGIPFDDDGGGLPF